jgi:hypothetical protein
MDYYELEPDIRRYISTFGNMLERKVYKCIQRIIHKLSEMNDRES